MKNSLLSSLLLCAAFLLAGCATRTQIISNDVQAQVVAGFSQDDINAVIRLALDDLLAKDCIRPPEGTARSIMDIRDVIVDTDARGRDAEALAEGLGITLREELGNTGKVQVYNARMAEQAKVVVEPQYILYGRLTQRKLRQDDGDIQIEYSLNLQMVECATGLEAWQKRLPLRKLADRRNAY